MNVFIDTPLLVVNSSTPQFEVCVNLEVLEPGVDLGERTIFIEVESEDGEAIG